MIIGDSSTTTQTSTVNDGSHSVIRNTEQSKDIGQSKDKDPLDLTMSTNKESRPSSNIDKSSSMSRPETQQKTSNLGKRKDVTSGLIADNNYVSLLTSTPVEKSRDLTVTSRDQVSSDQPSSARDDIEVNLEDPKEVWDHALSLASQGKIDESTVYFRIHAQMTKKGSTITRATSDHTAMKTSNVITEGGLSFIPGAITSHSDIGFTPFFDRNLRELKGPIPLTIFNKQWQELANSYHVEKRVKTDNLNKDITTYTGYPYPHKMTQSYAAWNVNYRNFVSVLRDVYNFKTFAMWAEAHQANVEFYHERDNWMTAFRYDIKIRLNAFAFRVSENGLSAPPDISQRRENIAALCFAEARRLDEGSFTDNPYAKGGVWFGFDWTTGLPRSQSSNIGQHSSSHGFSTDKTNHQSSHNNNRSDPNNQRKHFQGSESGNSTGRGRGGYNGKNYDPNFAAKKAASVKPTQGSSS